MKMYLIIFSDGGSITRFAEDENELKAAIVEEFPGRAVKTIRCLD